MCSSFIIIFVIVGFVSPENNFSSASIFGPDYAAQAAALKSSLL